MICRATSGATTCAGTPTGSRLVYDAERRLKHWQDKQSSPATTEDYLYDGAGQRIQKKTVSGSTITLTTYIGGGIEEAQSVNGGAVTLTKYLGAPGMPQAIRVGTGGTLSYLASDGLSSVSEALDSSGTVTSEQLYAPYGGTRYTNGTMPTNQGFTGQRADSASSGLDYYGARYYDPVLGQFASADTVTDGLNRFGYVHGNPATFTDPSGHRHCSSPYDMGCGDDSFVDSNSDNYDDPVRNVHVRPHGGPDCPEAGCAHATRHSAVVGSGKQVRKGDDHNSSKYEWGNDQNGATAVGYSGKSLDILIRLVEYIRGELKAGADWLDQYGDPSTEAISQFVGFIAGLLGAEEGPGYEETSQAAEQWANVFLNGLSAFVGYVLNSGIAELDAGIAALQDAALHGESVWYVGFNWNGQVSGGQRIGLASFYVGATDVPPMSVLYAVGVGMMANCQAHIPQRWGNSPGLTPDQDHSYTAVC